MVRLAWPLIIASFVFFYCFPPIVLSAEIECITCSKQIQGTRRRDSFNPKLSGNGRFVVFESRRKLSWADHDKYLDVYVFDRENKKFELIHPGLQKRENGEPCISRDGNFVVFYSQPPILLHPKNVNSYIYLFNRQTKENQLISVGEEGEYHNGAGRSPFLAAGADLVLFTSNATNLSPTQSVPIRQVYLFDAKSGILSLITKNMEKLPVNRASYNAKISSEGRFIAFKTAATNLEPSLEMESLTPHLYLVDRDQGSMIQVDEDPRGFDGANWVVGDYDMSDSGKIVFAARPRFDEDPERVLRMNKFYVFDRVMGKISALEVGVQAGGIESPGLNPEGSLLVFTAQNSSSEAKDGGVFVFDFRKGTTTRLTEGDCRNPAISADGSTVVFESKDPLLVGKPEKEIWNILLLDNNKF